MDGDLGAAVRDAFQQIGNLQGQVAGQIGRTDRIETRLSDMEKNFNGRFDGMDLKQDAIVDEVRKIGVSVAAHQAAQKARAGVVGWMLGRVEFLVGIAAGLLGAWWSGRSGG